MKDYTLCMSPKRRKSKDRRILKRRARPLDEKFKRKKPASPASGAAPAKSATAGPQQSIIDRVCFYIRHRPSVRADDLAAAMREKYGTSSEETWSAVKALERRRAVRVHYPRQDRTDAVVSALWQE